MNYLSGGPVLFHSSGIPLTHLCIFVLRFYEEACLYLIRKGTITNAIPQRIYYTFKNYVLDVTTQTL